MKKLKEQLREVSHHYWIYLLEIVEMGVEENKEPRQIVQILIKITLFVMSSYELQPFLTYNI